MGQMRTSLKSFRHLKSYTIVMLLKPIVKSDTVVSASPDSDVGVHYPQGHMTQSGRARELPEGGVVPYKPSEDQRGTRRIADLKVGLGCVPERLGDGCETVLVEPPRVNDHGCLPAYGRCLY